MFKTKLIVLSPDQFNVFKQFLEIALKNLKIENF